MSLKEKPDCMKQFENDQYAEQQSKIKSKDNNIDKKQSFISTLIDETKELYNSTRLEQCRKAAIEIVDLFAEFDNKDDPLRVCMIENIIKILIKYK